MDKSHVYLAGPIAGCTLEESRDWREKAKTLLQYPTYDPLARDFRGQPLTDDIVREIVLGDKEDIQKSKMLLAFYTKEKPCVGTSMEICYAFERGKVICLFHPKEQSISPWLRYHSHWICHTVEGACAWINRFLKY